MNRREITLHAFCSVKGGVGKSTLAVACAKLLAQAGETCLVIDADLTGTSLADGLRLRAPKLPVLENGTLDLDAAPSGEFYTVEETRAEREKRRARDDQEFVNRKLPPVYLNDALLYNNDTGEECKIDTLFWRHEREDDPIFYFPSSSIRSDVSISMGWLYSAEEEAGWRRRFAWLLDEIAKRKRDLRHIIVDLPPGTFGFAKAVLELCGDLNDNDPFPKGWPKFTGGDVQWRSNPCLVLSQDENDFQLAVEFYRFVHAFVELRLIVNRHTLGREQILASMVDLSREEKSDELRIQFIADHKSTLGKIFQSGVNHLDLDAFETEDLKAIREALGLEVRK